jgi:hypothetical protein
VGVSDITQWLVEVSEVAEPDEKEVLVMDVEMGETKKRKIKKLEKTLEKQRKI